MITFSIYITPGVWIFAGSGLAWFFLKKKTPKTQINANKLQLRPDVRGGAAMSSQSYPLVGAEVKYFGCLAWSSTLSD
jgi:hypothetical protein